MFAKPRVSYLIVVAMLLTLPATVLADEQGMWTVSGRVVDPDDKPFAGAKLYVIGSDSPIDVQAVTDDSGEFSFQLPRGQFGLNDSGVPWQITKLVARADGYGCDAHAVCSFEPTGILLESIAACGCPFGNCWDRTLKLVRDDVPITGRVVDTDGHPVSDASIRVTQVWIPKSRDLSEWESEVEFGEDYDIVMLQMMDRNRTVSASNLHRILPSARTDRDGRFRLQGGIGRERIVKVAIEGDHIATRNVFVRTRSGRTYHVPHILEAPQGGVFRFFGSDFEYTAETSYPITGSVRDISTGKPLEGVSIRFVSGPREQTFNMEFDGFSVRTTTKSDGKFVMTGAPAGAEHTVLAISADQPYMPAAKTIDIVQDTPTNSVDFQLTKGVWIDGSVTNARTGVPAAAQLTYFVPPANELTRDIKDLRGAALNPFQKPYLTDSDGMFRIVGIPGRGFVGVLAMDWRGYTMSNGVPERRRKHLTFLADNPARAEACFLLRTLPVYCSPDNNHQVTEIEIPDDVERYRVDISLEPEVQLQGRVSDPDGKLLAGVRYAGMQERDGPLFAASSPRFTINGYRPERPRQLYFIHEERELAGDLLIEGPQPKTLAVQLKPWGSITGRIVDSDGKPQPKALIRGWAPGHGNRIGRAEFPRRHYFTNDEGRFKIAGLVPGLHYELELIENGKVIPTSEMDFSVESGETRDLGDVNISRGGG